MQCQIAILKIAETVEPLTSNQQVGGSSPPGIATNSDGYIFVYVNYLCIAPQRMQNSAAKII